MLYAIAMGQIISRFYSFLREETLSTVHCTVCIARYSLRQPLSEKYKLNIIAFAARRIDVSQMGCRTEISKGS